jgi:PIN domain nuclease of toxin-antitoxin system
MKLLLDTHIWLWSLLDPARLTRRVKSALRSDKSELWLSPISLWELRVMVERGKIQLQTDILAWIDEALRVAPMREAPVTNAVVRALSGIETPHGDPADRFLAATAATLDLQLVTSDGKLLHGKGYRVLGNQ